MAELTWQVDAIRDLDEVAGFIARQSPDFAPIFVRRIAIATDRLDAFPMAGRVIPEIGDAEFRELIFQNYRIVYWTDEETVIVLGVLHSALDFGRVARDRGWFLT